MSNKHNKGIDPYPIYREVWAREQQAKTFQPAKDWNELVDYDNR